MSPTPVVSCSDEQRRFGALLDRHEDTTLPDLEALAKRLRHQAAELHRAAMLVRRRGQRGHSADPGSAADGDAGGAGGAASMSLRFSSGVVRRMGEQRMDMRGKCRYVWQIASSVQ